MATKKSSANKNISKGTPKSMPKAGKDPRGGLTEAGRQYFAKKEGARLKPGVTGAADTPEKMRRKGSFLRRHFAHPRGPMKDEQGRPTRLALSAHAWGEPVPKDDAAARRLAQKGHKLLERYHATQVKKSATRKATAKKTTAERAATKKVARKTAKKAAKKSSR